MNFLFSPLWESPLIAIICGHRIFMLGNKLLPVFWKLYFLSLFLSGSSTAPHGMGDKGARSSGDNNKNVPQFCLFLEKDLYLRPLKTRRLVSKVNGYG